MTMSKKNNEQGANKMIIETTPVFDSIQSAYGDPAYRFIVCQGGSRSSKTYSTLQLIVILCLTTPKLQVSIVRKSLPAMKASVMRDFFEILKGLDYYSESLHNMTENTYTFVNGSSVEFFSADNEQKLRGRKRDLLYCNEGNELSLTEYTQLVLRTTGKVIIDFNPSDTDHWIYDLLKRENALLLKSTYKDNPFLNQDQVEEIENLINVDHNYYLIYALGERPTSSTRIYSHFRTYVELPADLVIKSVNFGLDFGFNHPTALVKVTEMTNGEFYVEELIYASSLTTADLISEMNKIEGLRNNKIYCDYSRPEIITELSRAGFKAVNAIKEVKKGIDTVKSVVIHVKDTSVNILKEYKLYSWKMNGEVVTDEPIKLNDDAMDAIRYAIHSSRKKAFNPSATSVFSF